MCPQDLLIFQDKVFLVVEEDPCCGLGSVVRMRGLLLHGTVPDCIGWSGTESVRLSCGLTGARQNCSVKVSQLWWVAAIHCWLMLLPNT